MEGKSAYEVHEGNPGKLESYMRLKKEREAYMNELKRLYHATLNMRFNAKCLQVRMALLASRTRSMQMILEQDAAHIESDKANADAE